jgi:transmembrane sensor
VVGVLLAQPGRYIDTFDTGVGEQRLVILKDGTRMSLNTSTRVKVELGKAQRRVRVEGGEAFFEVAKDASRPFVVQAAGTEVTATGTAFVVRVTPSPAGGREALDVTLVEGQVVVQGGGGKDSPTMAQPIVMAAGDRIRVRRGQDAGAKSVPAVSAPEHDRPRLDQVLAWKRGEAVFDNASLPEALAEMNRYSATPIMADPSLAALRISGLYRTGDNAGFARAVAALHGLVLRAHADRLELLPRLKATPRI